jgi:hypothetical protein
MLLDYLVISFIVRRKQVIDEEKGREQEKGDVD